MLFFNTSVAYHCIFFVYPSELNLLDRLEPLFYTIIPYSMSNETVSKNSDRFKQQGQIALDFENVITKCYDKTPYRTAAEKLWSFLLNQFFFLATLFLPSVTLL